MRTVLTHPSLFMMLFNAGSFQLPWKLRPSLLLLVMTKSWSVFQGEAESLREPLCPHSHHLNPSVGFGCASRVGLILTCYLLCPRGEVE